MDKEKISFMVNGEAVEIIADPARSLLQILREELLLTGAKEGCSRGECGACTVLLDDLAVNACLVPLGRAQGKEVMTVEGLAKEEEGHLLQMAFIENGAVQCGFCSPGMLMAAYSLLKKKARPTPKEVKMAISGNLCRCTGYAQIIQAMLQASEMLATTKSRSDEMDTIRLDGNTLRIEDVVHVARNFALVEIAEESRREIIRVREYIDKHWMSQDSSPAYGFNTGVGKLKSIPIKMEENDQFQYNLVMSHCGGVGDPISEEIVRATMVVRINAFCQGASGLRMEVIDRLLEMLNKGVHPVIPELGSVGASGDLAPLAHMVAVLIGYAEAEAFYRGERMSAPEALKKANITPVEFTLKAKDCLALINGSTLSAGMAALNCYDAQHLVQEGEIAAALSLEAIRGETAAFDPRIQQARKHKGQIDCAANIRMLLEGTKRATEEARKIVLNDDALHREYKPRVQDAYSFRCVPQVQGAVRDNLDYVNRVITEEINAATDNPLVFWNEDGTLMFYSGGNFHGEPIAFAMDILSMSLSELGSISDRRIFTMLDPTLSYGLPPNLAGNPAGLNYGYGIIACSASALASENKTLCFPASVDSISTKSNQEDHVSMAPWAARKAKTIIDNVTKILGIEYMIAAEAISLTEDQLGAFPLGKGTSIALERIRQDVKAAYCDTYMPSQSTPAIELVKSGEIVQSIEDRLGKLL